MTSLHAFLVALFPGYLCLVLLVAASARWRSARPMGGTAAMPNATYAMQHAQFRAWLRALPQDVTCAIARDCHTCPLAMWLQSRGVAVQQVLRDEIVIAGRTYTLPPWAHRFVFLLDDFHPYSTPDVTPADALRILDAAIVQTEGSARHVA